MKNLKRSNYLMVNMRFASAVAVALFLAACSQEQKVPTDDNEITVAAYYVPV